MKLPFTGVISNVVVVVPAVDVVAVVVAIVVVFIVNVSTGFVVYVGNKSLLREAVIYIKKLHTL